MGSKCYKEEMREEILRKPITFGEFVTKEKVEERYLGDWFHTDSLTKSLATTVETRPEVYSSSSGISYSVSQ